MSKTGSAVEVDLEDRDPNNLHEHLQVSWKEVVGEPGVAGARSPECAWRLSERCFRGARAACYTTLSVLAAPPAALLLGCCFACLSFQQIWCSVPCLRVMRVLCSSARVGVHAASMALIAPVADALARLCGHVRVQQQRMTDAADTRDDRGLLPI